MVFPLSWDGTSPSRPDPSIVSRSPDARDWDTLINEHIILPKPLKKIKHYPGSPLVTDFGTIQMMRFVLTGVEVTMVDAGVAGSHGSVKLLDFDSGNQYIGGADFSLVWTAGAGGITDTAAFVMALGTVATATDNATLASTEANIHPSVAGTLVAGVDTLSTGNVTAKTVFGGLYLNVAIADAGSTADDIFTIDGTVSVLWTPWF